MSAIYILSDFEKINRYKVGFHTGTLHKLRSRYITGIPTLIVHYFVEIENASDVEKEFKSKHIDKRIINTNQRLSEWVNMKLHEIISSLTAINLAISTKSDILIPEYEQCHYIFTSGVKINTRCKTKALFERSFCPGCRSKREAIEQLYDSEVDDITKVKDINEEELRILVNKERTLTESMQLVKYKLRKEYEVEVTKELFERCEDLYVEHNTLVKFAKVSGIEDEIMRKRVMEEIGNGIILNTTTKRDRRWALTRVKLCYHALNILRIIGCNDFMKILSNKRQTSSKINKSQVKCQIIQYIMINSDDIIHLRITRHEADYFSSYQIIDNNGCFSEILYIINGFLSVFKMFIEEETNKIYLRINWQIDKIADKWIILPKQCTDLPRLITTF